MCTPPMRYFGSALPERIIFINPAAGDSISIAITDTSKYSDGILRFNEKTRIHSIPVLLSTLKNIILVSIGADHVDSLTRKGNPMRGQWSLLLTREMDHRGYPPQWAHPSQVWQFLTPGQVHN
ncbi:hypothetical protein HOY82DRAFT_597861 [Tuber indicum]|nr:hypothetical protein HOY82DRAFT_597861 [Tuber indicum]